MSVTSHASLLQGMGNEIPALSAVFHEFLECVFLYALRMRVVNFVVTVVAVTPFSVVTEYEYAN
ncbi:hypothetical protein BBR01nite_03330 [Brevibacillus brevis]|nr:hypothetical protein BBR01nite_03330 [Brevibacillus brevis]